MSNHDLLKTLQDPLFTVQDCIDFGEKYFTENQLFFGHGTDNAADEALWLVFFVLELPWDSDEQVLQERPSEQQIKEILSLFQRRVEERIPIAYLTGEAWFAGYAFAVNQDVLVPRSPIAELIATGFQPWLRAAKPSILDLCTGCGCIGIATALSLPDSKVLLSDISADALVVAQQNSVRHNVDNRVEAIESDLFESIPKQAFDLIVSNPPYVDADDLATMPAEYHAEPELALASGADGLDFTRRLLVQAADYLSEEGLLIVEVGNSWVHLEKAFSNVPFTWLEFAQGGHGVFVMTRQELVAYQAAFS